VPSVSEPVTVNLEDFLRSGEFGPVRMGMSRDELLRVLGEPERLGGTSNRHPTPVIWKYGDIEFHFHPDTELLFLVHADAFDVPRGALGLAIEPGWIRGGVPLEAAMQRLAEADLASTMRVPDHDPGHALLELESGVLMGFNLEGRRESEPRGMCFFGQGPR
jgi:hypothetical protein